jgi:hypothetical protein
LIVSADVAVGSSADMPGFERMRALHPKADITGGVLRD